jgi:hypothetical protein
MALNLNILTSLVATQIHLVEVGVINEKKLRRLLGNYT